jgi:hypothetical protein
VKSLLFLSFLLLNVFSINFAHAQSITINASNAPYNLRPALNNISIYSAFHDRTAAVSDAASLYRSLTGGFVSRLKPGVIFKITYKDGTSESAIAGPFVSEFQAEPIPGTQSDANGSASSSGGGGLGAPGGGRVGVIGYSPVYDYTSVCTLDGCTLKLIIVGYRPIYGNVNETL